MRGWPKRPRPYSREGITPRNIETRGWPKRPRPYSRDGITPRNIETQCENIDVENQNTVRTGLGGHTSDPFQNVLDWIAYLPIVIGVVILVLVLFISFLYLPHILMWLSVGLQ